MRANSTYKSKKTSERNVLLIEDDGLLSEMYLTALNDAGFRVQLVNDGKLAKQTDLTNTDLVLLDIRLPGVGGMDLLRYFRDSGFTKPIIILTNSPQADAAEAARLGANDLLVKSHTDIGEVLNTVNKYLVTE